MNYILQGTLAHEMAEAILMRSYAIVTFGTSPRVKVFDTAEAATKAAQAHWQKQCCSAIRVHECKNRDMAKSADIGVLRDGESIIWTSP